MLVEADMNNILIEEEEGYEKVSVSHCLESLNSSVLRIFIVIHFRATMKQICSFPKFVTVCIASLFSAILL